jgi:predicted metal-dependent hydrolase
MTAEERYARGDYFEAHELWEDAWRAATGDAKRHLQGRVQLCAAAIQAQRGRWRGVATLAARAVANLEPALAPAVRAWADRVLAAQAFEPPPAL